MCNLFAKKKKKSDYDNLKEFGFQISKKEYNHAIKKVDSFFSNELLSNEDKRLYLKSLIKIVKMDLQQEHLAWFLYGDRDRGGGYSTYYFPLTCKDNNGNTINIRSLNKTKQIDLKKECVLVRPWENNRLLKHIKRKSDFEYDDLNHMGDYYRGLDITVIYNGLHSITDCILNRDKGSIIVDELLCDELFDYISTDGEYWYNSYDNSVISIVIDFRIAILFELNKKLIQLK